jgi:EpsI family protein
VIRALLDKRLWLSIAVLVGTILTDQFVSTVSSVPLRKNLSEFPKNIGSWQGVKEDKIDDASMKLLQVDDYLMRRYENARGDSIYLYIGFYYSQREGKGIHSPRQCLPGSGWMPISQDVYTVRIPGNNVTFPVNRFVVEKAGEKQLFLFWYQGRNRLYASEMSNKLFLTWDAITKGRTDGALLRLHCRLKEKTSEGMAKSLEMQEDFIRNMFFPIQEFVPR